MKSENILFIWKSGIGNGVFSHNKELGARINKEARKKGHNYRFLLGTPPIEGRYRVLLFGTGNSINNIKNQIIHICNLKDCDLIARASVREEVDKSPK